jgi:hypothetical protein
MKILFAVLLLLPAILKAQNKEPFKQANAILITTHLSIEESFQLIGQSLLDAGYTIDKTDEKFHTIQTNVLKFTGSFGKTAVSVIIRSSVRPATPEGVEIKLSGTWSSSEERPTDDITYRGMKGSPFMIAFGHLDAIAKTVAKNTNGEIKYTAQ